MCIAKPLHSIVVSPDRPPTRCNPHLYKYIYTRACVCVRIYIYSKFYSHCFIYNKYFLASVRFKRRHGGHGAYTHNGTTCFTLDFTGPIIIFVTCIVLRAIYSFRSTAAAAENDYFCWNERAANYYCCCCSSVTTYYCSCDSVRLLLRL